MGFAPAPLDRSVVGIARDAAGTRLELPSRGRDTIEDNFGIQITAMRVIQQSGGRTELADTSRLSGRNAFNFPPNEHFLVYGSSEEFVGEWRLG